MSKEQQKKEAVGNSFLTDAPSSNDYLGFSPYVEGLARFISDPSTKAPLTISIEGEWGTGKSSFLKQLQYELKRSDTKSYTVWFDSWRYDKEESIWAAFSLSFLQQVSEKRSVILRPWLRRKLKWKRIKESRSKFWNIIFKRLPIWAIDLLFLVILIFLPIIYFSVFAEPIWSAFVNLTAIDASKQSAMEFALKMVPLFPWLIIVFKEIRGTASGLLESNLNKYINNPNYEDHIQLLNRFHNDFRLMVENYASNNRVYVFIDDLDRCDGGKAAELMQAINLMVHDTPQIIFLIAMDRKKIAAGYAMHHEKILPFLSSNMFKEEGRVNPKFLSQIGLEYGYSYIEKFIQVPFLIPKPTGTDIQKLLDSMNGVKNALNEDEGNYWVRIRNKCKLKRIIENKINKYNDSGNILEENNNDAREVHFDTLRILLEPTESITVKNIILKAANYMDYNPRRIKQFINMFRLYAYLADGLGMLQLKNTEEPKSSFTLEQLGKIVVISLRWPQLITEAIESKRFVNELLQLAYGNINLDQVNTIGIWKYQERLLELLKDDCKDEKGNFIKELISNYGFNEDNFLELFKIASPVFRLETSNIDSVQIVIKDMTIEVFSQLVIELLRKNLDVFTIKMLKEEWWGKRLILLFEKEESIIVEIEKSFDIVDVHSIEAVKDAMDTEKLSKGLVITCGNFEGAAVGYSIKNNIDLWDGAKLINTFKMHGYNVSLESNTIVKT